MALDIQTQDIIIDESIGLTDDDINPSGNTNPTLLYLLGLDDPGGLTSPEVAHQADFVQASASAGETISGIVLAKDASGTPFSKTVGVNSGIQTVDGNYVWLFQDSTNPNVVIGVIGTSDPLAEPDENGPLAFAFGLDPTSATKADLYLVQYVPLLHPDETDPDDRIDLTDHVFASVTGTSVLSFLGQNAASGNHDFYVINSSTDASKQLLVTGFQGAANATANVSTQGFGIGNQSINPTETLQCDFVTGGNLPAGDGSQIQYGSHLDNVTQAGFTINQITPSAETRRVDITIRAFDNTGNEQGSDFFNGTTTNPVDITSIKLTGTSGFATTITADGTYATGSGNVTISGLNGTGNAVTITGLDNVTTVDFTTATQMDRLTVTGVDATEGCDITEFHFTSQSTNAHIEQVGSFINFDDDGPTVTAEGTIPTLTTDDTDIPDTASASFANVFTVAFGTDDFKDADDDDVQDTDAVTYALGVKSAGIDSGLNDTVSGDNILLRLNASGEVEGYLENDTTTVAFLISVDAAGEVTLTQNRSIVHNDPNDPVESGASAAALAAADLVTLTATATDGDGDTDEATADIGNAFNFEDDGPTVTVAFDGDQTGAPGTHEILVNVANASATGAFGYKIGADARTAAFYTGGGSDFVDQNGALAGIQIGLSGTIIGGGGGNILDPIVTLASESLTSATFDFTFTYDKDPAAGVQTGTAAGTIVFDKVNDTYTINLTDPLEGFSTEILHTSELVAKAPTGNTGHPQIVAEQLTENGDPDPFFIQFTANSLDNKNNKTFSFTNTGDGASNDTSFTSGTGIHEMVSNNFEDWVSATQTTNGVAGDTIQKGELLTLRFFQENILSDVNPGAPGGGTEKVDPTAKASGIVIKFDGIGNSEDLVLILDLKDANGNEITRAVNVQNSDLIKGNANVPPPYNTEFTLDNNDALLIIEQNDYTVAGETYQIQGVQIMQSANGLTGNGINLNGATGAGGDSSTTSGLTAWDPTDNDVLKIVDIGFVQQSSGTVDANLDFAFNVADADGDQTDAQHILVDVA
ncbi:hypothetical protein N183_35440 [Sinorhizobium sp. Sb3]|uniref:DUF5801 repeats-in-toxin domain-containing protein n=1 Tax=Sinorhizobium sp. Sb3 TaxID=1358417 RepID=UPI00071E0FCE|nr:DUF5801 repeats-in-toxin domain-containing protein [Sinorhizobium sp. Sb3]KSV63921.1 hypothetical protein N183_35440 [Sinorhizobium sp. Sb3]